MVDVYVEWVFKKGLCVIIDPFGRLFLIAWISA